MTTFEQAQQIVADTLPDDEHVNDWGWESDTHYQITTRRDTPFRPKDGPYRLVNKTTGELTRRYGQPFRIGLPIGLNHPDNDE